MQTATSERTPGVLRSRWTLPGTCLVIGAAYLFTQGAGGDWSGGAISLGIMLALGAVFLFGARWDPIRQLRGDTQDERGAAIDLRATALAGTVTIVAVIVALMTDVARGGDGAPYAIICAVGGIAYIAALVVLRRRI